MPTSNKTPALSLNNWLGTDKPMRSDFTEDNLILDSASAGCGVSSFRRRPREI